MEERALGTAVRPIQGENIGANDQPHPVTFGDYVEKLLGANYSQLEKGYLNYMFLNRKTALKPRRHDGKSSRRMVLSLLAKDYEEFVFDVIKRKMDEQEKGR